MSFVLTAEGFHDRAIANKWLKLFEIEIYGINPEYKEKIWRVVSSCKDEDQLSRYFRVVSKHSSAMAHLDTWDLSSWVTWHVKKTMSWL